MFIFWMIWSLASVLLLSKMDKKLTIKTGGDIEKKDKWDDWHEYYNGRVVVYKVCLVLSLIPFVNLFIASVCNFTTIIVLLVMLVKSSFWQKEFWNKIF